MQNNNKRFFYKHGAIITPEKTQKTTLPIEQESIYVRSYTISILYYMDKTTWIYCFQ